MSQTYQTQPTKPILFNPFVTFPKYSIIYDIQNVPQTHHPLGKHKHVASAKTKCIKIPGIDSRHPVAIRGMPIMSVIGGDRCLEDICRRGLTLFLPRKGRPGLNYW